MRRAYIASVRSADRDNVRFLARCAPGSHARHNALAVVDLWHDAPDRRLVAHEGPVNYASDGAAVLHDADHGRHVFQQVLCELLFDPEREEMFHILSQIIHATSRTLPWWRPAGRR
jgi:hypothetical protein